MVTLTSYKSKYRRKKIMRDREKYYTVIKGKIHKHKEHS